jgi:hypothetical protein
VHPASRRAEGSIGADHLANSDGWKRVGFFLVEEFVFFFFCSALAECWTRPGRGGGGSLILSGSGISSPSFASGFEHCHNLSAIAHLFLDHGSGMVIIIILCAFFSSHSFATGLSNVSYPQQCHISCLIMEAAHDHHHIVCTLSSHSFAPGLTSVSFSQQCHISCFIMEVAW